MLSHKGYGLSPKSGISHLTTQEDLSVCDKLAAGSPLKNPAASLSQTLKSSQRRQGVQRCISIRARGASCLHDSCQQLLPHILQSDKPSAQLVI